MPWCTNTYRVVSKDGMRVKVGKTMVHAILLQHKENDSLEVYLKEIEQFCNCNTDSDNILTIESTVKASTSTLSSSSSPFIFDGNNGILKLSDGTIITTDFASFNKRKRDVEEDLYNQGDAKSDADDDDEIMNCPCGGSSLDPRHFQTIMHQNYLGNSGEESDSTSMAEDNRSLMVAIQTVSLDRVVAAWGSGFISSAKEDADLAFSLLEDYQNLDMDFVDYMSCKKITTDCKERLLFLMAELMVNAMDDVFIKNEIQRIRDQNDGKIPIN